MKKTASFFLVILAVFLTSCVTNPATHQKELDLIAPSQEIAMGRQEHKKIISQFNVYRYKNLNNYVKNVGLKLTRYAQDKNIKYTFTILNSPAVNAFSTPGGYVYITRGILAYLNNEAQLACVLGHEMGHINAHHVATQLSKQLLFNLALGIAYAKSKKFRKLAPFVGIAGNLLFLSFSRSDEYQADYLGVEYATLAGYDAAQMADFFKELEKVEASKNEIIPEFLSTHPSPPHREQRVLRLTRRWQAIARRGFYEIGRDVYLKHIDGILFGKDKRNGYTIGNHYYHPNMRFTFAFPKGWKLIDTNNYIGIFPQKGSGIYIKIFLTKGSIYSSANRFSAKGILLKARRLNINGFRAVKIMRVAKISSQLFIQKAYFISFNGKVMVFFSQVPSISYPLYAKKTDQPAMTFKRLRNPKRINVKNLYVKVVRPKDITFFSNLLDEYHIKGKLRKTIYIINNMQPDTLIAEGEPVKILIKR